MVMVVVVVKVRVRVRVRMRVKVRCYEVWPPQWIFPLLFDKPIFGANQINPKGKEKGRFWVLLANHNPNPNPHPNPNPSPKP